MQPHNDNDGEVRSHWNDHFSEYVEKNWKKGTDIDQKSSEYASKDTLTRYWTEITVSRELDRGSPPIPIAAELILEHYLRVWSTLVYIGYPHFITWFRRHDRDDEFFYSSGFTEGLYHGHDPQRQAMLKKFGQHWCKFWPVRFTSHVIHKRNLDSERVLPVTCWRRLSQSESTSRTTIYEVDLDPECCEVSNKKVVFKIYNTKTDPAASLAFTKEADIFETLGRSCEGVIVQYLGSFIQHEKSVIVLEHANGGNLWDFFKTHRVPRNNQELIYLWTKLFKLVEAINHLHHPGRATVGITHRDLKFENILFFKNGSADDYEFEFKLTDFDTSTSLQNTQNGFNHQDNDGSRTRSAPEASRILDHTEPKSEMTPLTSDIWQLGTVFSEALICILWDHRSLSAYEKKRREETSSFRNLENSGLEICFHDGEKRLACIQEFHQEALDGRKAFDRISEPLVALIEDHMLVPHDARLGPKMLSVKFAQLLDRIRRDSVALPQRPQKQLDHAQTEPGAIPGVRDLLTGRGNTSPREIKGSPSSPTIKTFDTVVDQADGVLQEELEITSVLREEPLSLDDEGLTAKPDQNLPRERESHTFKFPVVTANDVELWRMNKKQSADPPQGVVEIIDQLQGRDQVFVIDDAEPMKAHLSDIIHMAGAMISLAKKADPNGVELIFTSAPDDVKKKSRFSFQSETRHLVDRINARFRNKTLPKNTHMEDRLGTVLERIARNEKQTSVYVLTDGVWQESDEPGGGVENPIKNLISSLNDGKRNRTAVTIQFIQFGNDAEGRKRLEWLDDELPNSGENYLRNL
ncbi:hypothetical protein PFICI_13872 [Pestalotiopsis fici W106-1]|uniref:Protein kinase domain-containing protein n=1 Tax=Pestalotiopsis fici (strain W106-1 / CGMCC3.15140) TaxID=1229662 RepID=W3WMG1_PESFW|nr:uncharacterized protein PFICI_13872 [Pestalotiopsis fici W106-1]ETS74006.1 hypothetical protein PFICI_13872 [Pestalotiopsis fici W106-1]